MNLLSLTLYTAFLVNLWMITYVLSKNLKTRAKVVTILLLISIAVWNLSFSIIHSTFSHDVAFWWLNISSFGWCTIEVVALWLSLVLTERDKIFRKWYFYLTILLVPAFFIYKQFTGCLVYDLVRQSYGWSVIWSKSLWRWLFYSYFGSIPIFVLLVGVSAIKKSKFLFEKRRIRLTISSGIIFLILATGVDVILPQLNYYSIPPFGSLTAFILAGSIIYGITKYRMMTITPAYAASDIISTMSDSLIMISPEGKIIEVNNAALSLLGYSREEIAGGPAMILFPEGTRHFLFNKEASLLNKESFDKHQIFLRTKKGEDIPVSFSVSIMKDNEGNLLGVVGVARDIREIITLQKREKELAVEKIRSDIFQERAWELQEAYNKLKTTQSQLIRSEEKALFGQMAGDVANELNNLMGIILGFAQSVLQRVKKDNIFFLPLKSIEHEVLRCIKLVKDLLIFSSIEKKKWEEIDINRTIEETLSFIEIRTKMNNIDIVKDYGLELPRIIVNENQIKKVIVNLVNNAIDAMPDGGKVKLSTKIVGDWILIEVSDNGRGMTEKVKKHLFEPFFTTKKDSEGAGLGLSLSYEIIHNHNGLIEVESEIDKGSVFIVKLPVLQN